MNILAIDTTMGACSVAIRKGDGPDQPAVHHEHKLMQRGHAEELMPMIKRVADAAGVELTGIDNIAVTSGPGTFTGVRIGISAARGLALALGCGIFAATSLRVIALGALRGFDQNTDGSGIAVAIDARRGEVYIQAFDRNAAPLSEACAERPKRAIDRINELAKDFVIVGSAVPILRETGLGSPHDLSSDTINIQPGARDLAELAAQAGRFEDHVSPLYLRAPDAKPQIGKVIARATGHRQ